MLDRQEKMVDTEGEECKTCGMGFEDLSEGFLTTYNGLNSGLCQGTDCNKPLELTFRLWDLCFAI